MDSDNDSPDYKEQFIESGIFEEEEMEIKMEMEKELEVKRKKKEVLREAATQTLEVDQQISQLNEEIVKLTQIRSLVEQRVSPSSTKDPSEASSASKASEYPSIGSGGGGAVASPLSKVSEYGSCEELEMINGPGRSATIILIIPIIIKIMLMIIIMTIIMILCQVRPPS